MRDTTVLPFWDCHCDRGAREVGFQCGDVCLLVVFMFGSPGVWLSSSFFFFQGSLFGDELVFHIEIAWSAAFVLCCRSSHFEFSISLSRLTKVTFYHLTVHSKKLLFIPHSVLCLLALTSWHKTRNLIMNYILSLF